MAFELNDENYEIIRPLGKGGMSTVYLAKDKNLDREVAIKLLHPGVSEDKKNRERLKIEALAIARINHENIVNVYSFVNKGDKNYIVMEYIDGYTLSEFLEKHPITSPELVLAVFFEILEGISFSHKKNIIHRDIKPENIMISKTGKIKIMDFGIASIIGEVHNLTTTGSIMGSPMFMSPEHLTDEKIDKQSDLFSLGIILYWMLTRKYPFNGKNTAQLLNNILKCQYDNPQKINHLISNDIVKIIKRILQKSKNLRYKEADEIIKDIKNYFEELEFDYKDELEIFFEAPSAYHKRFVNIIPEKYIRYAKKLYHENQHSKAISYAYLALEYSPENKDAKDIIRKIEKGNFLKRLLPLILIFILSFLLGFWAFKNQKRRTLKKIETKSLKSEKKSAVEPEKKKKELKIKDIKLINIEDEIFKRIELSKSLPDKKIKLKDKIKDKVDDIKKTNKKKNKLIKKIKKQAFKLEARISPKAASVFINDKFYGYGNIRYIELKTHQKYKIKITSKGCYTYEDILYYRETKKIKPLTVRLKWKPAVLMITNTQEGDIFINNNYKGNYKKYNYEVTFEPLSNGSKKINLKIIKNSKIIFIKDIILKAGQTVNKKI